MSKFIIKFALIGFLFFTANAFGKDPNTTDAQVLTLDQKGVERLQLQHDPLKEYCDEHLKKAGPLEGKTVWDLACATGAMTLELAKLVGPNGHVHAFDINPKQLAIAEKTIKAAGLNNVTFHQGDIGSLKDFPKEKPDLVYIRCLLSHLKDPEKTIAIAKDLLKPGGVVLSIEPIKSTSYYPSNHQIFCEYRDVIKSMGKLANKDYDLGERLESLYTKAGFTKTEGYFVEPKMDLATTREYFLFDISRWTYKAVDAGVLTEEQVKNWKNTINNWPNKNETFTMAKYAFVIARKEE